ncbi:MAG: beta-lactamase family protein [Gemmatimonadetes bacterium]|nr:beta-lactamase family protein [Gemmatimonadota bacterium]
MTPRVLLLVLATGVWLGCDQPTAPIRTHEELTNRLARIVADSAAANGAIGSQAAVRIPGHEPWLGTAGQSEPSVPMRSELMIGTGSISKMYTAVAALRLIDRGVLRLGDPIGRWFPATPHVDPSLTLERLLQNTSGLADYGESPDFAAAVRADPGRGWTPAELLAFVGPPLFPPGGGWDASNTNRLLLGMIVERESGQALGAFLRNDLYPGSRESWLGGFETAPGPLAAQWFDDGTGRLVRASLGPALFSVRREIQASAGDLAIFAERLFAGDLLSTATRSSMLTFVTDDGRIAGQTGGGLGVRRFDYLGRTLWGHSGGTGNSSAMILFDPPTGITVALSINQGGPSHRQSHFRTAVALLQAAIEFASPSAGVGR